MAKSKKSASEEEVQMDRRGEQRRKSKDRREQNTPVAEERRTGERRRKVQRRRQIDPTTCERDYTNDEIEFMQALDAYKRANGRMFPTCSEILEVVRALGYVRLSPEEAAEFLAAGPAADGQEADAAEEKDAAWDDDPA